jgi:hypothetical protein
MFRYLYHAFFARPDVPLLRLPWNALACVGAAVAGFWDPAIWGTAMAGEMIYLLTMASHPGFQHYLNTAKLRELREDTEDARRVRLRQLGGAARQRYVKLEEKRKKIDAIYTDLGSDDLLVDSNRDALQKLTWLYLNLLVAQRNLIVAGPVADTRDLDKQIAAIEREIAVAPTSQLRESKEATLRLLRGRLENSQQRHTSMAEIESDLARIDAQLDVALEEASLRGRPVAISANIELTSHLLSNVEDQTTWTAPRELQ